MTHPIRSLAINVFQAPAGQPGPRWIALFGDGNQFPIRFSGLTESDVRARSEGFRADVCAKHEATFDARRERAAKMLASRRKAAE